MAVDIVAHEIGHGVTRHSSHLVYSGESGGLNEGFSDIFGTAVEYYLNDPNDRPDFYIAEMLGTILRNMENPDRGSIGSVCQYHDKLNVHYSSGVVNKAYVSSVRSCVSSGCGDLRNCAVVMGTHFMYSNINGLTRLSNFLDSAKASCEMVDEFFTVLSPDTQCTPAQVRDAVQVGWDDVDIYLDGCEPMKICGTDTRPPKTSTSTAPITSAPTKIPSAKPSATPSAMPSTKPTTTPSSAPKTKPTIMPSAAPSTKPSMMPTAAPTKAVPERRPDPPRAPAPAPAPTPSPNFSPTSSQTDSESDKECLSKKILSYVGGLWHWW